jgi:hypothetical protein
MIQVNKPKFDLANITNGFFLKGEEKYPPQTNESKVGFITLTLIQINQICNKPIENVVFSHMRNKLLELKYQVCS